MVRSWGERKAFRGGRDTGSESREISRRCRAKGEDGWLFLFLLRIRRESQEKFPRSLCYGLEFSSAGDVNYKAAPPATC